MALTVAVVEWTVIRDRTES